MLSCVRINLEKAFLMQKVNFGEFHGAVWISSSFLFLFLQLLHTPRRLSWSGKTRETSCFSGKLELVTASLGFLENIAHLCSGLRSKIKFEGWKSEIFNLDLSLIPACEGFAGDVNSSPRKALPLWAQLECSHQSNGTLGMAAGMCLHNPLQFLAGFSALSPQQPLVLFSDFCPCAWQGQREAEVPQRKLFQFHVTPVLSKDLFFVDSEPLPCLEKPGDDLAPLTEVPVLSSKPVLGQVQPARLLALALHLEPSGGLVCSMCCSTSPSSLNPFFQAMESEISAAFDSGEPEDILSRAFKLTVTREDICTLQPLGWLNDRIMNFYMGLLVERSKKEGYPAVYAFNTFFYSKLSSTSHKGVKKWTKDVDIFEHDVIFVPIHLRIHWTLLVIDLREKTIKYFDSLGQKGDHICKTVLKYLEEESREKRNIELTASEWTLHSMGTEEIPQQNNGNDCGVFVCKFADFISRDKPIIFTPEHMPYFRRKMVWEIIHQQLLGDMH
uniref:Ubiquitin-like protease family profile domain-containing protein n=1 Tax=Zonotrichia albicollis TaxID=44394 RepID=A0A8D2MIW7_ZONAL